MPFTLAHPAAAVPLRRVLGKSGVLSALIIGSLTPDFAYFLPWNIDLMQARGGTHSLLGIFWFCLPVGLLAYWVFHALVKHPALLLLPEGLHARLTPVANGGSRMTRNSFWAVVLSLGVGALTHPVWDGFTHYGAPGMQLLPVLGTTVAHVFGQTIRLYNVLQHSSTLLGLGLLTWWTARWYRAAPRPGVAGPRLPERTRVVLLATIVAVTALGSLVGGWSVARVGQGWWAVEAFVWHAAVWGMGTFGLSLILFGLVTRGLTRQVLAES
ncbi:MAG: DUF4184 family protein [Gemmatimonadales bacterium]|nr:DUF4184 family protein [Gemmatimonadales bacterium]